jgi:copper chaperone CopZ
VGAALAGLTGVQQVHYDPRQDIFTVQSDDRVSLAAIFTAIFTAGKKLGRDYFPELIS